MSLLSNETFLGQQKDAVFSENAAIAVTAGAGSGKTRSLVGRYLHLLERGYPLRSILAITFTEKAAREMRGRIRTALSTHPSSSFILHPSDLDSARIGTIHSLCAETLRQYPAEAGLDPAFAVLEEGQAAALKAEALDTALAWAATDAESVSLFEPLKESELRQALGILLERRLDVGDLNTANAPFAAELDAYLSDQLNSPAWLNSLADLSACAAKNPEDKLELARRELLAHWDEAQNARAAKNWDALFSALANLRKSIDTRSGRKDAWDESALAAVREAMTVLKETYEEHLKFLAEKARFALDEQVAAQLPALLRLLDQVLREYQRRKDQRQSLDFDDLEGRAARLLTEHPAVRTSLQSDLRAVLVDEFQDTNERQRQIVYALTGFEATLRGENRKSKIENQKSVDLFIVGDSKQSIYKFRGADVSVFRQVQHDVQAVGGERLALDLTFRAHKALLETLNGLLAPVLGETDDLARPYLVPFTPLRAHRVQPARETIQPPYIEIQLGLGENAEDGRQTATAALAIRLCQLHETEGFAWGDIALLFRASSAFPVYENALEAAGIPFVTVAGRGFYDRPEIRDLLNALTAIADPADDLALLGLLRSPAFAIPDAEIYQLRFPDASGQPANLNDSLHNLSLHPFEVLSELRALAGRTPASAVLKLFLDRTGYRAILGSVPGGTRMIRNVEKLLADAHRSRITSLPTFLSYVRTLRDIGLREGEAPADPSMNSGQVPSSGAVQLMTVHKAKGLEFPLTVLADASYEPSIYGAKVQLSASGLLLDLKEDDFHSTAWQIAARHQKELEDAEDCRLLYVAATRAKEKLLISGHVKAKKDGSLSIPGWLGKLGLEQLKISDEMTLLGNHPLNGAGLSVSLYPAKAAQPDSPVIIPVSSAAPPRQSDLLEPIIQTSPAADEKIRARESDPPQRVWRIVPDSKRPHAPAWVVGKLVHESLRRWYFPDSEFETFLQPFALESGLTDPAEIRAAIHETRRLLERFRAHPLYLALDSAERRHEVPYFTSAGRGVIDLLYRSGDGWTILDFKTDRAGSENEARVLIHQHGYDQQLQRYAQALTEQLGVQAKTRLVFLNVKDQPLIFDL